MDRRGMGEDRLGNYTSSIKSAIRLAPSSREYCLGRVFRYDPPIEAAPLGNHPPVEHVRIEPIDGR